MGDHWRPINGYPDISTTVLHEQTHLAEKSYNMIKIGFQLHKKYS